MGRYAAAQGMVCPPAGGGAFAAFPGRDQRLPAVDERLAPPETRVEYLGGVELFAAPAGEPPNNQDPGAGNGDGNGNGNGNGNGGNGNGGNGNGGNGNGNGKDK